MFHDDCCQKKKLNKDVNTTLVIAHCQILFSWKKEVGNAGLNQMFLIDLLIDIGTADDLQINVGKLDSMAMVNFQL